MIYTIGETVLDIIIKTFDNVKIKVGGSMLNSAVSLGRLGLPVSHVSCLSEDVVSERILTFLDDNKVNRSFICQASNLKTNLALAFLDEEKKANYSFYKNSTHRDLKFEFPDVIKGDIILFGSFFSLNVEFREQLVGFLSGAKKRGAYLIYDPNFRKPHLGVLKEIMPYIEENLSLADLVKGSDEDFQLIFNVKTVEKAWAKIRLFDLDGLVYTRGAGGATFINQKMNVHVNSESIVPISTIGAGDTFNAGVIYYLSNHGAIPQMSDDVCRMLGLAHEFSSQVCQSMDNYLSVEYINKVQNV